MERLAGCGRFLDGPVSGEVDGDFDAVDVRIGSARLGGGSIDWLRFDGSSNDSCASVCGIQGLGLKTSIRGSIDEGMIGAGRHGAWVVCVRLCAVSVSRIGASDSGRSNMGILGNWIAVVAGVAMLCCPPVGFWLMESTLWSRAVRAYAGSGSNVE